MSTRIHTAGPALDVVTSCLTARQEKTDCDEQSGNALFGCSLDGGPCEFRK